MEVPSFTVFRNRGVLAALAVVTLFWGAFFVSVGAQGLETTWASLRVHSFGPPFVDMFAITQSWDLIREGGDPFCSAVPLLEIPLVYPRSWAWLTILGIGTASLQVFSLSLAVAFYAVVCFVLAHGSLWRGLVVAVSSLSPAVLLCMERMNADIMIFLMLSAAVLLVCRQRALPMAIGFALASLAGMLKLFPAPAIPGFLPELRKLPMLLCAGALGAFAVYILVNVEDLMRVDSVALRMNELSFGAGVTAHEFSKWAAEGGWTIAANTFTNVVRAVVVISGVAGLWCGVAGLIGSRVLDAVLDTRNAVFFRVGSMLYVATYLLVQSFNYRLMFLLFCVPFLVGTNLKTSLWRGIFLATGALVVICLLLAGTWALRGWHGAIYGGVAFAVACVLAFCLGILLARMIKVAAAPRRLGREAAAVG